jgi:PAS domain S-box-containing protein
MRKMIETNTEANINYAVMDDVSYPVIVTDMHGRIVFLNASVQEIQVLHDPPFEVGRLILDSVGDHWKKVIQNVLEEIRVRKTSINFEADYCIQGKRIVYEVRCHRIVSPLHHVNRMMFEFRDITLQKIYENKVSSIANDLGKLIDTANTLIMAADTSGFVTEWNNHAEKLTGFSKSDVLAKHFSGLFVDAESQLVFSNILAESMHAAIISNRELPIRTKSLGRLTLLVNASAKRNMENKVVGVVIIGLDITELTDYRLKLEQKVRDRTAALERALNKERELVEVKKRFVSIASHEFRSPIGVIKTQALYIRKMLKRIKPQDVLARLDRICEQVDHMAGLLEDVLLIGKGEAGKLAANLEPVDLIALLHSIIDDVSQAHNTHHIEFICPNDSLIVETDKRILRNIFINLLSNAIKFSPDKSRVYFEVKPDDLAIEFKITDEGIGISDTDMEKIFQPFNRGSNAQNIKGTGLGLSIVKKAIETLNGRLVVESKLNVGTKFTVLLPNCKDNEK